MWLCEGRRLDNVQHSLTQIVRTALSQVRAVFKGVYHRDQRSLGYHLQVVLFRSG